MDMIEIIVLAVVGLALLWAVGPKAIRIILDILAMRK